jgi:pilus assembly protein CpaB
MRNRFFAVLLIALTAGGGLAYATYTLMSGSPSGPAPAPATQPVVVAAADLQLGTEIKPDDVRVVQWPQGQAPEGAFARPQEVIGRGLIVPVVRNEPILAGKLAPKEAGSGLPPAIPQGMRAVSVRVNEVIGVAGYVLPGSRVDVLATVSPTQKTEDTTTKVVLTNVPVLTAGTRMEQDQRDGKPMQVTVVTLAVTPEQAERLALASTEGKIQLALRNPLDRSAPETPGVKPAVLLGTPAPKTPAPRLISQARAPRRQEARNVAPPDPALPVVEVIRGDKRTTEVIR